MSHKHKYQRAELKNLRISILCYFIFYFFAWACMYIRVKCVLTFACIWAHTCMGELCVYMHMETRGG